MNIEAINILLLQKTDFLTSDGVAVSNFHIIAAAEKTIITTTYQCNFPITHVLYTDPQNDIAIVMFDETDIIGKQINAFLYVPLRNNAKVKNEQKVFSIGNPLWLQNTIAAGIIDNNKQKMLGIEAIQITASISHSSSGSALFNKNNQVINITFADDEEGNTIGFAIPIILIKHMIQILLALYITLPMPS